MDSPADVSIAADVMETEGRGTKKTVVCKSLLGFEENNKWKERVVVVVGGSP